MGIRNWFEERRQHQRLVKGYLQHYRSEAHNDGQAKAMQEALLIEFLRLGLSRCIENVTMFPFGRWTNWNTHKTERAKPQFQNQWLVDIAKVTSHYWENRVVGCRNPMSDRLNTSGYTYNSDLTVCLFKWLDGQRHYVFVSFWLDGRLKVGGVEETFNGKLPDDDFESREKFMLALLQAMNNPIPDEKDLIEKQKRDTAATTVTITSTLAAT